jgi:Domain of unknown function (DUF4388)
MEGRRGARVATTFLVAIEGLEERPEPRQGDISATGVYFETKADVGGAGTIHWLHLVSVDSSREIRVMACVVRTAIMAGADGEQISGAAFEFMPESDEAITALHDFVRYALALRFSGIDPHISPRLDAKALAKAGKGALQAARKAMVRKLSVRSMVLETSWAIAPGESVRVDIVAPGMTRRIRLEGKAVRVAPRKVSDPSIYTIEVEVQEESDRPIRHHSSMSFERVRPEEMAPKSAGGSAPPSAGKTGKAGKVKIASGTDEDDGGVTRMLDDLLSALILPPEEEERRKGVHHLSGQIARVRLPTLCSLFEMERLSGVLVVRRDIEEVRIYLDTGQIVDVEPLTEAEAARARLRSVMAWEDGSFAFDIHPVSRPDRIGMTMTALLLEMARESDEAARDAGG